MPALNDLYRRYSDRAAFYVVYIQEAHPVDFWQTSSNIREHVLLNSTRSLAERTEAASTCVVRSGLRLPAVIDKPDDRVERAYTGWPDRLYLVESNGHVAYKSAAGPFGFEPSELERALKRTLKTAESPDTAEFRVQEKTHEEER